MSDFSKLFVMSYDGMYSAELAIVGESEKAFKVENTGYDTEENKGLSGWIPKSGIKIDEVKDQTAYANTARWFYNRMDWKTKRILNLAGR